MNFEFSTASKIIFGIGKSTCLTEELLRLGKKPLLIYGRDLSRIRWASDQLKENDIEYCVFSIHGEPDVGMIKNGADLVVKMGCDCVVGIGGGSVIDAAKAIAAIATNRSDIFDYLEVVGRGENLSEDPLPVIAVPTTSGTGAEVTKNSVITSKAHKVKVSLRHPLMLPRIVVVDPGLTKSVPRHITAYTGLDAFTQLLESFVSVDSNPLTDALCREGLKRAADSLEKAYKNGNDINAREDMAFASLVSGIALANAKLGAVHGFAAPIGGMFDIPHGVVCASLLPFVTEENIRKLGETSGERGLLKFREASRIVTGNPDAGAEDIIKWISDLCSRLSIPILSEFGVNAESVSELSEKALNTSSIKGNPVTLTKNELEKILLKSL